MLISLIFDSSVRNGHFSRRTALDESKINKINKQSQNNKKASYEIIGGCTHTFITQPAVDDKLLTAQLPFPLDLSDTNQRKHALIQYHRQFLE